MGGLLTMKDKEGEVSEKKWRRIRTREPPNGSEGDQT